LKFDGLPDVIAYQAFKNCDRILFGLKKSYRNKVEDLLPIKKTRTMDTPIVIPWNTYHKKKREAKWRNWLHEYVYVDFRDESSALKRFQCFQYFCTYGLIPFVNAHKYNFNVQYNIANELANLLYYGEDTFCRSQPFYREQNQRAKIDLDYDYYIFRGIPDSHWEVFWDKWQWMTDFYDENFRNRYFISNFVYDRLNLETSEAVQVLTRELEEDEDGDDYFHSVEQASEAIGQGKDKNSLY
jgi:hypothetical protein